MPRILTIAAFAAGCLAGQERVMESVVAPLSYGSGCSSTIQLKNVSGHSATVEIEGHRESGALVGLAAAAGNTVRIGAGQTSEHKLDIDEETDAAWLRVRERVPSPEATPGIAIRVSADCVVKNEVRSEQRRVVFPMRNPWFSSDVEQISGNSVSLINVSETPVRVMGCYSSGGLYSVGGSELRPVCNDSIDVQVPPFGSRQFAVSRNGNSHFSLRVRGERVVLEMLKPAGENRRIYHVDSTIQFGETVNP